MLGKKFTIHTDPAVSAEDEEYKQSFDQMGYGYVFDFSIVHRDGRNNGNADELSQQAWEEDDLTDRDDPGEDFLRDSSNQEKRGRC